MPTTSIDCWGGAFGLGLSENVRQGYRFLSQFYEPGDEIYIFGFSRGAFTARSLVEFVAASGLLKKRHCDEANLAFAWNYYRTPPKKRFPAVKGKLEKLCSRGVRIKLLGVFDTVGALGIPVVVSGWLSARQNQFHDTKLGSTLDYAFHALAIDEHRGPLVPTLWAKPDHANNLRVEQVWFPGVHSDVGGGFPSAADGDEDPISQLALYWMLSRLNRYTPQLEIARPE